jgi:hypothetical protein
MTNFKGTYTTVDSDGSKAEHTGLSMYLGVSEGNNPKEAFADLYQKHGMEWTFPDLQSVYCFKVDGQAIDVDVNKGIHGKTEINLVNDQIKCEWCGDEISNKGAARYSHLQKHARQLLKKGKLTKEQAVLITGVKLPSEVEQVFAAAFRKSS